MKRSHARLGRRIAPYIAFLFCALSLNREVKAQGRITDSVTVIEMLFNYSLNAYSHTHYYTDIGSETIYDDYDYVQYLYHSTYPILWNCGRTYLISTYTTPDDTIPLSFTTTSSAPSV